MTTQGSISQPVLVTGIVTNERGQRPWQITRTVAKFREIFGAVDLQHDYTQNVILRVETVFPVAGLPGLSKFTFLLFDILGGDGFL